MSNSAKDDSSNKSDSRSRQLANLKPFKKGQSGNPNGRTRYLRCGRINLRFREEA
jgi:hypothetical protein